jgi:methionyl-tRNA formyltransferase
MAPKDVLLLASRGSEADRIAEFCRTVFSNVVAYHGDWGQPFPDDGGLWHGDLIVSYCSRWIIPEYLLKKASYTAINFHPAPPTYPGVGGISWALYNNADAYGVTCHHMVSQVDAGQIIEARHFPILPSDNVESLYNRTHLHLEGLAFDILSRIALNLELPKSLSQWSGKRRTRNELDNLTSISSDMSSEEVTRRIRATNFGTWKPTIMVGGYKFQLKT